jgi:hypothetical protein
MTGMGITRTFGGLDDIFQLERARRLRGRRSACSHDRKIILENAGSVCHGLSPPLGRTLRRLPGEYCVNFLNGETETARFADDLDEALELGRAMAATKAAEPTTTKRPPRRSGKQRLIPVFR